jgi:hypothetical protein
MGHGPHSSTLVVICVVRLLFVLFYVLFMCKCVLPPSDNPTAVNKYINIKNLNDTVVNRTRDLPTCKASVVARFEGFIFGHVNVVSFISAGKGYESNICE